VRFATEPDDDFEADLVLRGMQAEHGWSFFTCECLFRDAKVGGNVSTWLRGVSDKSPHIRATIDFLDNFRFQITSQLFSRQTAGDGLETFESLRAAFLPFFGTLAILTGNIDLKQMGPAEASQLGKILREG
jgi:hypothetical protein